MIVVCWNKIRQSAGLFFEYTASNEITKSNLTDVVKREIEERYLVTFKIIKRFFAVIALV